MLYVWKKIIIITTIELKVIADNILTVIAFNKMTIVKKVVSEKD